MKRTQRTLGALLAGAALWCTQAGPARAEGTGVTVELTGCAGLDSDRIAELIALELAGAFGTTGHGIELSVAVTCGPDKLAIDVHDPVTDKSVGRRYPALSPDEEEPERAVALAAAQLFVVSWLELLVPKRREAAEPGVAPETVAGAREAASRSIEQPGPAVEVAATGGLRLRALPELAPVGRFGALVGGEVVEGLQLFGLAAFETGRMSRDLGTASLYALWLGLGAAYRWPVSSIVSFEAGVAFSGGYALLRGEPFVAADHSGDIDGLTGELAVLAGPVLTLGRFVAALDLQGGYSVRNPIGTVEGEDEVSFGGFFAGAIVRLGLLLG